MPKAKTIGVVNGGGDAPGLNAVIRAAVRTAIGAHNLRVVGIRSGFDGLIWPEQLFEMNEASVMGILQRGGTILGTTNRGNPFAYRTMEGDKEITRDYSNLCIENARRLGIDALIVIGGDGTLHIANDFVKRGLHVVGVQRGGSPSPFDRVLGTRMGVHAVDLAARGQFGRMVRLRAGRIESVPLEEAISKTKFVEPDCDIVHTARSIQMTFGDGQ